MRVFDNFLFLEFFRAESEWYAFKKLFWLEIRLVCWCNSDIFVKYFAIFFLSKKFCFLVIVTTNCLPLAEFLSVSYPTFEGLSILIELSQYFNENSRDSVRSRKAAVLSICHSVKRWFNRRGKWLAIELLFGQMLNISKSCPQQNSHKINNEMKFAPSRQYRNLKINPILLCTTSPFHKITSQNGTFWV